MRQGHSCYEIGFQSDEVPRGLLAGAGVCDKLVDIVCLSKDRRIRFDLAATPFRIHP